MDDQPVFSDDASLRGGMLALTHPRPPSQNPVVVYLSTLSSARSRRVMLESLHIIAYWLSRNATDAFGLDWAALRFPHTVAVRAFLMEHYSPASVNRMLSGLRGVLKAAWRLGQMSAEDYHRARDVGNVRNDTLPSGRELVPNELIALVEVCKDDPSPAGVRDMAILAILYSCGLRREELVTLEVKDFDATHGKINVLAGKGRKARTTYAQGGALKALESWMRIRGYGAGPLFVPVRKNGELVDRRMSAQAIYYILKKRAEQAGVADFSPHDMRRTFISDLLDRGADIATVAKLAGHRNVQTTARYDRRPETTKQKAAKLLNFPY